MSKKIALILKNLIWNCSHWSDSQVAMHCLSAREYRVGVDVVADAVQVLSLHIESTKEHCIHSKIFFFFIWLPQPWSDYFCECARQPWMPSLLKSDGSRQVWHRWGTKIFKTFGTKLQTLDPVRTANKLELCKFGFSQHHDDIQGTLLLMGQVQLSAQWYIMLH